MTAVIARVVRCSCGRMLGVMHVPADHADCPAHFDHKCGKCDTVDRIPVDPNQPVTS